MREIRLTEPYDRNEFRTLRAGDRVLLSGTVYTARDAAHQRMAEALGQGEPLPVEIADAIIYYMGPTPAPPGRPIGSAGPTSSYRMDGYAPGLLDLGQLAMIGKGPRSEEVREAIRHNGAVYFAALGGAGALISRCIRSAEVIAYEDLGAEAIRRLTVENLPLIVAIDSQGTDLYGKETF